MPLYLCLPLLAVLFLRSALGSYNCSSEYERTPDNSDLSVDCGTAMITLEVNLCTAQWAGFDYTKLAMNGQHNTSQCQGTIDNTVDPPVIRYQLPVNHSDSNPCRHSLQIVDEVPDASGPFSNFNSIQSVIITGYIDTPKSTQGLISYSTDLYYHFSCRYPLEYLLNNTQIVASSVSVATSDSNGTFIDTLKMSVYNDSDYGSLLRVPTTGLQLRTKIYVEVKAVNLTGNFFVLLDHCFATRTAYNTSDTAKHDFFIGCTVDPRTTMSNNGESPTARFNFEVFRFMQDRDKDKSSIYLHCILRLCEPTKCKELLSGCSGSRRKRRASPFGSESRESATVSAGPLYAAAAEVPIIAASGELSLSIIGNPHTNLKDVILDDALSHLHFPLCASEGEVPSGRSDVDVTGLVVGVVFGSAGAVMLVLGGWFVLKKFYWAGALPHAFN
ncbi:zona pellucida-like domain-containing protein 1 [Genypterus blacodes]|uniref:zona pellucida-like domain-containing protein 1 n=1 Tax=Genypterus blacodes TaxID=154954 RepID=UPI003F764FF4